MYVDNKYNYELFFLFYEKGLPELMQNNKSARIFLNLKSKLPYKVHKEIHDFFENDITLKNDYYNDNDVFGVLDRSAKAYMLNHKSGYFSLDMTIDTLDKNLFQSKSEMKFLKLTSKIEKWCDKLRDDLMKPYGY